MKAARAPSFQRARRRRAASLVSLALLAAVAAPARAQAPPALPPWHQGVSEERKQRAYALFQEARDLHRRMMLAEAREKYQEALASWEHPELRLYLARVLRSIGLPLLAHESLRLSLQWGPGALTPEQEQEARSTLRALVQHELAAIEIRCDERGARVLLDGKPWFVGPGAARRMITPGEHVITARKEGYFTVVKPVLVLAGKEASGHVTLSVDAVIAERRWAPWVPWATLGAGAALGVAGAGLWWQADVHYRDADRRLGGGCDPWCTPSARDAYDASVIENRLAIGAFVAGGAAMITGTVLLLMNGPQSHRTDDRGGVRIELLPVLPGDVAGLSARLAL
ncbi:PEGA domain-containing protein [Sorangium cellulosum]|uniref:Uncharacterized protein n=2 Tax=Sorangium cellulosum TaxID=56 RepID=S4Y6H9_SORCE|nr:PEGA domain-containing protein [Sorangium cellulosum]AGP41027.1 hypothetical protein SCE1572_44950 [Sorangium cellulosum So0157-2]